jgi:hypothetical protein
MFQRSLSPPENISAQTFPTAYLLQIKKWLPEYKLK